MIAFFRFLLSVRRCRLGFSARSLLAASVAFSVSTTSATAQAVKIIGWGATSCSQFQNEISENTANQREYLSWAQGYMSGIIMTRLPGVDENLDLNPPTFPWIAQFDFLRVYCAQRPGDQFIDAVEALYKRLRLESAP